MSTSNDTEIVQKRSKTITPEGEKRKRERLIAKWFAKNLPEEYSHAEAIANSEIRRDNKDPFAHISTFGVDSQRHRSPKLDAALRHQLKQQERIKKTTKGEQ